MVISVRLGTKQMIKAPLFSEMDIAWFAVYCYLHYDYFKHKYNICSDRLRVC